MNLKFWSWELKFWTLLVLRRSVSHRWFPSPKQISVFHNQNLCENLNRTSFAQTSWFLVKVHIKANNCRIILFEQFRTPEWRNRPQNWNLREKLGKQVILDNFDILVKICVKVNFWKLDSLHNFQVSNKETDSKSECTRKTEWDRPFFENFDFLVKVKVKLCQSFFSQAVRTGSPIRVGSKEPGQAKSGKWHHHDVIELEGRVRHHGDEWEARIGACERVKWRWWSADLLMDLLVLSVFWNSEHICIGLKEEAVISEACSRAWRRVLAPVILIFQGFINWSPFKVLVGSVLWNDLWIFTNLEEKVVGDNLSMMTFLFFFLRAALTRRCLCLDLRVRR